MTTFRVCRWLMGIYAASALAACASAPGPAAPKPARPAATNPSATGASPPAAPALASGTKLPGAALSPSPAPAGFERLFELEPASRIDFFNLGDATVVVLHPFPEGQSGEAKAVWVVGGRVTHDPQAFAGLGPMGWVDLDTRGRPYPLRSALPDSSSTHEGDRRITSLAGTATERRLAVVTWSGSSGAPESTSALFEWTPAAPKWRKLRDTGDTAVVGAHDVGVVAVDAGAVVVERDTGLGKPGFPQTHRLQAVGTKLALPKLALTHGTQACPGSVDGIAALSRTIVAWGVTCAVGQSGYVVEWWAPGEKRAKWFELPESPEAPSGGIVPQHDALLVRPDGNLGYRMVLADGRWEKAGAAASIQEVRDKFGQAQLPMWRTFDATDGSLLVLARCRPDDEVNGAGSGSPRYCLYRSSGVTSH